jgi:predicted alpha/beta superfamily hydrolase
MRSIFILVLLLTTVIKGHAQASERKALSIGETRTLASSVLNENRTLNIYLPGNYDSTKAYPVIYLLDGSLHEDFLHIVGLVQFFTMQLNMPETIVVGIANVDRKKDFTYHTDLKDLKKDYPTTGHSAKFISFVETELLPYISANYKTTATRYLIGQSLGGLLATEILLKKAALFSHYLIVSPSLWWDDESMLKKAAELFKQQADNPTYVYISVGKGEHKTMQKEAKEIYEVLLAANKKNLTLSLNVMEKENHATILHNSIYAALLQLFPYKE